MLPLWQTLAAIQIWEADVFLELKDDANIVNQIQCKGLIRKIIADKTLNNVGSQISR